VRVKKPYYEPYLKVTKPMRIEPRRMEIWKRMEGNRRRSVKTWRRIWVCGGEVYKVGTPVFENSLFENM
jgi:hypothetical protein